MSLRLPTYDRPVRLDVSLAIVNIVLLLIFFFLVLGRLDPAELRETDIALTLDLPLDQLPPPVLVIREQDDWLLDGETVSPDLVAIALDTMAEDQPLHLVMDRFAPAGLLAMVLAHPGLSERNIRLVTRRTSP